jgi:hypothetical protein
VSKLHTRARCVCALSIQRSRPRPGRGRYVLGTGLYRRAYQRSSQWLSQRPTHHRPFPNQRRSYRVESPSHHLNEHLHPNISSRLAARSARRPGRRSLAVARLPEISPHNACSRRFSSRLANLPRRKQAKLAKRLKRNRSSSLRPGDRSQCTEEALRSPVPPSLRGIVN